MTESTASFKYWAFISYSHQDEAWAQWLHQALETYRVPRRLVGRALRGETVPRRLFPIFRDRDELPSSHELGAVLTQALRDSRNLIVICSPRSATSRWVNEEIKAWRALGRSDRIYCLIVDGEPNASATPELAFSECFAPALRGDASFEPIAADARERKDGKSGAKLKLIAGLLGLGLDELKQREKQRQFWQRVQATAAGLAFAGLCVGAWQWYQHQRDAREQEIRIEKLVENGRLELLDGRNARAAVYLTEALKLGHDTVPLRYMLGQAMQPIDALTKVRIKHGGGPVRRAAFSPDGKQFVLVVRLSDEAVAKVYDSATGEELAVFGKVPPRPSIVQFLPDSKQILISGLWDGLQDDPKTGVWKFGEREPAFLLNGYSGATGLSVHPDATHMLHPSSTTGLDILDVRSGATIGHIGPKVSVPAASFSPDGNTIALTDAQGKVSLWSFSKGTLTAELPGPKEVKYSAISFTPDGQRVVALSSAGDVRIWSVERRELVLAFAAYSDRVLESAFSPDGRRLLTVGSEGYKVWNTARGIPLFSLATRLQPGANATLSADGNVLLTADHENNVSEVWDVRSQRRLYSFDLHTNAVTAVALDPSGERLLLASQDGHAEILNLRVKPWWRVQSLQDNPSIARFDTEGGHLLVAGAKGSAGFSTLYGIASRTASQRFDDYGSYFYDIQQSPDGRHAVAAAADGTAAVFDTVSGKVASRIDSIGAIALSASFNADGSRIAVRPYFTEPVELASVKLWDALGQRTVADLTHGGGIHSARFNHSGTLVATAGEDGMVSIWDAKDGRLLKNLKGHTAGVRTVQFSQDGERILTAAHDDSVRIWDFESGTVQTDLENESLGHPNEALFSPAEDFVAIGNATGSIWLWWPHNGKVLTLTGHQSRIHALRFLHGGRLLLSSSFDGSIRIWDTERGTELGVAAAHRSFIFGLDVNPAETFLATAGFDGLFAVWNIALETRSASALAPVLACRSPWVLAGTDLLQSPLSRESCLSLQ